MAKIFNGPDQLQQRSITSLCESFLNLSMKKRPAPAHSVSIKFPIDSFPNSLSLYQFTEAKVSMALFKQWHVLKEQVMGEN